MSKGRPVSVTVGRDYQGVRDRETSNDDNVVACSLRKFSTFRNVKRIARDRGLLNDDVGVTNAKMVPRTLPRFRSVVLTNYYRVFCLKVNLRRPFPVFPALNGTNLLGSSFTRPSNVEVPNFTPERISTILAGPASCFY